MRAEEHACADDLAALDTANKLCQDGVIEAQDRARIVCRVPDAAIRTGSKLAILQRTMHHHLELVD